MIKSLKQRKIKFKPRIKLNHNRYIFILVLNKIIPNSAPEVAFVESLLHLIIIIIIIIIIISIIIIIIIIIIITFPTLYYFYYENLIMSLSINSYVNVQ